jgi:hypothetical protein
MLQIVELQDDNKLLEQLVKVVGTTCNKSVELNNLVASCQQAVDNLSTSWEQAVRTHPVNKLLEQHCYKSAAVCYNLCGFMCSLHHVFTCIQGNDKSHYSSWVIVSNTSFKAGCLNYLRVMTQ